MLCEWLCQQFSSQSSRNQSRNVVLDGSIWNDVKGSNQFLAFEV